MHFTPSRVACALVFLLSSAIAPSALAHAHLKQQSPQENTVATAPDVITLNFSEGLQRRGGDGRAAAQNPDRRGEA